MKSYKVLLLFFAFFDAFAYKKPFITAAGQLSESVIDLLKSCDLYKEGMSLADAVEVTQKAWIAVNAGKNNIERRDLVDPKVLKDREAKIIAIAKSMKLFDASSPSWQEYDYAICLGAFLPAFHKRLRDIVNLWNSGIRFKSLVFLTGERYLRKNDGDPDAIANLPKGVLPNGTVYETEYDMAKVMWEQADIPADMRKALEGKVIFVNALRGEQQRPTTKDTYRTWLSEYNPPKKSKIVATSSPLLWHYQHLTGKNMLKDEYELDTVAPEYTDFSSKGLISTILDTVAKCLYELHTAQ